MAILSYVRRVSIKFIVWQLKFVKYSSLCNDTKYFVSAMSKDFCEDLHRTTTNS